MLSNNQSLRYLAVAGASVAASVSTFFLLKSLRKSQQNSSNPCVPSEYIDAVHDILSKSRCLHHRSQSDSLNVNSAAQQSLSSNDPNEEEEILSEHLQLSLVSFERLIAQRISSLVSSLTQQSAQTVSHCTKRLSNHQTFICLDCDFQEQRTSKDSFDFPESHNLLTSRELKARLLCEKCAKSSEHQTHRVYNISTCKLQAKHLKKPLTLEEEIHLFNIQNEWNTFGNIDGIEASGSSLIRFCQSALRKDNNEQQSSSEEEVLEKQLEEMKKSMTKKQLSQQMKEFAKQKEELAREIESIFELLFRKQTDLSAKEFNGLISIVFNQILPLVSATQSVVIASAVGSALTKSNSKQRNSILARIVRVPLDTSNASSLSELLLLLSTIDASLNPQIYRVMIAESKFVISSIYMASILAHGRSNQIGFSTSVPSSELVRGMYALFQNAIVLLNRCDDAQSIVKHKHKILRCFALTASAMQQSIEGSGEIAENILKAPQEFMKGLKGIAQEIDRIGNTGILKADFMKLLLHTDVSQSFIQIKEIDFSFSRLVSRILGLISRKFDEEQSLITFKSAFVKAIINDYKVDTKENDSEVIGSSVLLNIAQLHLLGLVCDMRSSNGKFIQLESHVDVEFTQFSQKFIARLLQRYLFYSNCGFEILQLGNQPVIESNPHNRSLMGRLLVIYGASGVGEFDLLNLVMRRCAQSAFIVEVFSEGNPGEFDVYQNLRFLFSDPKQQQNQLLINVMQILHRSATLSEILALLVKFTDVNAEEINFDFICDVSDVDSSRFTLKSVYEGEFYPLVFAKYPEYYAQLLASQKRYCKFATIQNELIDVSASTNSDSELNSFGSSSNNNNLAVQQQQQQMMTHSQVSSISSMDQMAGQENKLISLNGYSGMTRKNSADVFGSDYDLFLLKDELIDYHASLMLRIQHAIKAFFLLSANQPSLTTVVSIYLRIALFQHSNAEFEHNNQYENGNERKKQNLPDFSKVLAPFSKELSELKINSDLLVDLENMLGEALVIPSTKKTLSYFDSGRSNNQLSSNSSSMIEPFFFKSNSTI